MKQISLTDLPQREMTFCYETRGYYDVDGIDDNVTFVKCMYAQPIKKWFTNTLFDDWLEDPICYGAYENRILIGIVEGSVETWNKRFRISEILVFEQYRQKGVGHQLMKTIIDVEKHEVRLEMGR